MEKMNRPAVYFWLSALLFGVASYVYHRMTFPLTLIIYLPGYYLSFALRSYTLGIACASLIGPILYVIWSFPLFKGKAKINILSKIAAIVVIALSLYWLIDNWPSGVRAQDLYYPAAMFALNVAFWVALVVVERINVRKPSFASNLIFHLLLFICLSWVAFPLISGF
jgi:hypothetical protein